jgi:MOSC domain-containing protein YiiM/ferredoxin-NADP reductase
VEPSLIFRGSRLRGHGVERTLKCLPDAYGTSDVWFDLECLGCGQVMKAIFHQSEPLENRQGSRRIRTIAILGHGFFEMSFFHGAFSSPTALSEKERQPREVSTATPSSILLAVFAGRIAPLGAKGVPSAFVKYRVQGPVEAKKLGLVGDAQADLVNHGGVDKAIYAYPASNYALWRKEYPEHSGTWAFGSLGENLAVSELDENKVCIGDVYRIGTALLQVTQPRKPCFKLALRYDGDQRIAARMVNESRTGWYFRVLQEGAFSEGQSIDLLESPNPRWSVSKANRAAYDRDLHLDELRDVAALPDLSEAWRNQIVAAANSQANAKKSAPLFARYALSEARMESATIRSLVFKPSATDEVIAHEPGQHVQVRIPLMSGRLALRRYTISSSPNGKSLQISVKKEEGGLVSPLLHEMRIGDQIEISRPQGRFILERDGRPTAFVSAGVGITPMITMLNAAVAQDGHFPFVPEILFFHAARTGADHAFGAQVRALLSKHPDATSRTFYSRPSGSDLASDAFDTAGRITAEDVAALVTADYNIYMCGPDAFMKAISEGLARLGFPKGQLMTETFDFEGARAKAMYHSKQLEPASSLQSAEIIFARSNSRLSWKRDGGTLLDVMEASGMPWPSDCRIGICGTCSSKILTGGVSHGGAQGVLSEPDEALLCCAFPTTPTLVLDI